MASYDEQLQNIDALLSDPNTACNGAWLDIPKDELLDEILKYIHFNGYVVVSFKGSKKAKILKW